MKWLKICALLVGTLAVMRLGSWAVAWALAKIMAARVRAIAIGSNGAAFTTFLLLLYVNLLPGESMDLAAVFFGFAVFSIYAAADCFWSPLLLPQGRQRIDSGGSTRRHIAGKNSGA